MSSLTMAEEEKGGSQLLRSLKIRLIDILSGDSEFVLQHAHSLSILSDLQYKQVKSLTDPCEKVRDILDHVIQKGESSSEEFLTLLKGDDMQETFPRLDILNKQPEINKKYTAAEKRKASEDPGSVEIIPTKQTCQAGPSLVEEKQLMRLAQNIGKSWKEIGRLALDLPTVTLEQIEEDHPSNHKERVFAMLRCWRTRQRQDATAARLHALLCQEEWALPSDSINFLLEPR